MIRLLSIAVFALLVSCAIKPHWTENMCQGRYGPDSELIELCKERYETLNGKF